MLGWIFILAALCASSAALGLGHLIPMASSMQGIFLALTAVFGMFLIASWDAFETQKAPVKVDDDY